MYKVPKFIKGYRVYAWPAIVLRLWKSQFWKVSNWTNENKIFLIKEVWISSIEMPYPSVREYCWWRWINRRSLEGDFENKGKIMSPVHIGPITPPHKINNWSFLSVTTIIIPYIPLENLSMAIDIICIVVRHIILTSIIYVIMMIYISCNNNPAIKQAL